jgi:hypothetical protein
LPQTPHHDISPPPSVIVPVGVEAAPALFVSRVFEDGVHDRFEMLEEDYIFRPGSAVVVVVYFHR